MADDLMRRSNDLLRLVTDVVGIAVWEYDFDTGSLQRTDNHDRLYGLKWQEHWNINTFLEATHPDDRAISHAYIKAAVAPGGPNDYAFDFRVIWPDGTLRWLWANGRVVRRNSLGQGTLVQGVLVDVTPRKAVEGRIRRLTQLYAALSQCNQAIVRCTTEAELFSQICQYAVTHGGMKMVWIGMVDEVSLLVKPKAAFGAGTEYLVGIEISTDAEIPAGKGPVGTCLRENHPVWCQDFQRDPTTAAWHARGRDYGWGAVASLPLHRGGAIVGAIAFYAAEPYAFDEAAQNLLLEMAKDISYTLDRFALEAERNQALLALKKREQQFRAIIETEPECVKILSPQGQLLLANATGLAMLEVSTLEEAQTISLLDFVVSEYRESFLALQQRVMAGDTAYLEFEMLGKKGTRRWVETHAAPLPSEQTGTVDLLCITRDITERKRSEERIRYLANFDALTGLSNRYQLDSHLNFALSLAKRNNGVFAVMFMDLDRFKDVNDSLGHRIGDSLLIQVANRLKQVLRQEDSISRLGGDEFILMFPGCDMRSASMIAQKLLDTINRVYLIEPYDLTISASIGIALYPGDGEDLDNLFKNADTAMYRAKKSGRNRFSFFTSEMQAHAARNLLLINALRQALARNEIQVYYQPQISLSDNRLIGVEALLRWQHPELGSISPAEFIPVAEDCGLILSIGEWVLRTAVTQLQCWRAAGHAPFVLSVNLSGVQFRHSGLPELLGQILLESNLSPEYLELELTESVMMNDPIGEIAMVESLNNLGIRVSIDDFGTGYSSLSYLKRFKVYKLKIDQTFVRDIDTDMEDRAIVSAIISMAKSLGLKTIAEGVETAGQLAFLREQGCDEGQGYFYSKPLSVESFNQYLLETGHGA